MTKQNDAASSEKKQLITKQKAVLQSTEKTPTDERKNQCTILEDVLSELFAQDATQFRNKIGLISHKRSQCTNLEDVLSELSCTRCNTVQK